MIAIFIDKKNSVIKSILDLSVMTEKIVLLIIDMQKCSFTPETPSYDTEGVVRRINQLATFFRKSNSPVFWIQHNGKDQNVFLPETKEWELLDNRIIDETDVRIEKYANDVFYNSKLQANLRSGKIDVIYITGCDTDFCVASTAQSALVKDYNIVVVGNVHTTGDRPHLKAEKIVTHYNWVWQNMIRTKGKINVTASEELMHNSDL